MKRIISFIIAAVMLFSLIACSSSNDTDTSAVLIDVTNPNEDIVTEDTSAEDTETDAPDSQTDNAATGADSSGAQTNAQDEETVNETQTETETQASTQTQAPVTYPPIEKPKEDSPSNVVFKQVYGTGYNTDTPIKHGFIELYNVSNEPISLDTLAISYMTTSDAAYTKLQFPAGASIAAYGRYLIRCGEAKGKNGESYEAKYEVTRIDYYDVQWNVIIDNKEIRLAITDKSANLSPTEELSESSKVYSYFVATESVDNTDRNVISGMSKQKAAYRSENTISSSFVTVDYSTMLPSDLADVRPQYSGGDRNTYLSAYANVVEFSHDSGFYDNKFILTLSASEGYKIYYTRDGSDPRKNGKLYTGGISLVSTEEKAWGYLTNKNSVLNNTAMPTEKLMGAHVIKAYATNGADSSSVVTNSYFIIPDCSELYNVPFVSLSLPETDFVSDDNGIYHTVMDNPFGQKERRVSYLELFESDGSLVSSSYVEIAMNGNGSLGMASKSMRIYFKADAESTVINNPSKLRYDIFKGGAQDGVAEFKRILLRNSGNDSSVSHIRDALMQALCVGTNASTMAYRPSLLFVNGEFWGVYNIRERYDTKYFKEHYGVQEENLVILEAPSPLTTNWAVNEPYLLNEGEEGDEKVFHDLVDYMLSNDLSNENNFKYVSDRIDLDSFTDFFVCSMYLGNTDWPTNNVKVWRNKSTSDPSGLDTKWRYVMSDMDSGMGLGCDYSTDMFAHALNYNTVAGSMMRALLENEDFKASFIARFTYAVENLFTYEKTSKVLDEYSEALKPIIGLHFIRWPGDGGSMSKWNSQINVLRTFLEKRPKYALETMKNYFGIKESKISFSIDLSKADLFVNGKQITQSGYSEVMAEQGSVTVKVVPKSGYVLNGIKAVTDGGKETMYSTQTIKVNVNDRITVICLVSKSDHTVAPTVVAGSRSIFVLDSNGDLYAWGENDIAQCGVDIDKTLRKPTLVMTGVAQVEISRGGTEGDTPMTAVLTDNGDVYTIGSNSASQLGRTTDETVFAKIQTNIKFKKIAVGLDHLLLLAENGDVYGCGNNAYGQLGTKNYTGMVSSITKIASGAVDIAAGRRHTLYITEDGGLYALGDNRWNKISSSAPEVITEPYKLVSDAAKVYAGQHSSLYISTSGALYYFGWRSVSGFVAGQSNGKMNKIANRVQSASVMDEHVIFLGENGNVYGFGLNNYGQISADKATKNSPVLIEDKCISASAGTYYSAYITEDGDVIVRGSNKSGVIGNGSVSNEYTEPYTAMTVNVE